MTPKERKTERRRLHRAKRELRENFLRVEGDPNDCASAWFGLFDWPVGMDVEDADRATAVYVESAAYSTFPPRRPR